MNNLVLFDDSVYRAFYPLTLTKPISHLQIGILTLREKWAKYLQLKEQNIFTHSQAYLNINKNIPNAACLYINSRILPNDTIINVLSSLKTDEYLIDDLKGTVIAFYHTLQNLDIDTESFFANLKKERKTKSIKLGSNNFFSNLWDIFILNDQEIRSDIHLLKLKPSTSISSSNQIIGNQVFIEEGAQVECAILNSNTGPIYIGKNAQIMEGAIIRGPLALCEGATIKMGAKIYGATTIGPYSKVGGEVSNSVIMGYSNKGHDGFIGNSVIGEWCNLGADTNCSNLKNNYSNVSIWSYEFEKSIQTDQQFLGLIMGDHAKCGINTMFNTGTVVGTFANIYGAGFPEKFIPDFSWGSKENWQEHTFEKAIETASKVMKRRNKSLSEDQINVFKHVFNLTKQHRLLLHQLT